MKTKLNRQSGQALIMLIVFMLIATIITGAAVAIVMTNSTGASKSQQSNIAYQIAESGVENALLQLLRNPNYIGETLPVGDGTASISVNNPSLNPRIITVTGSIYNMMRKIQVNADYTNSLLTIVSWKETTN